MARAAILYYQEDATQAEIARMLGISRIKVCRLLRQAREQGIVEIRVLPPPSITRELEEALVARFDLRDALLSVDQPSVETSRRLIADRVADLLVRHAAPGSTVAVGMGRNTGAVGSALRAAPQRDVRFVAAIGGSPSAGSIDAGETCRRLAAAFGGTAHALFAPAYADTPATRSAFLQHEEVSRTLAEAARAQVALVGIGDAENDSAVVGMGCFSAADMQRLRSAGAVGDILGSFFDIDGRPVAAGMQDRVISLTAQQLRAIPLVVGIAPEAGKSRAILGALKSGMVEVLATTMANAREVLRLATEAPKPSK